MSHFISVTNLLLLQLVALIIPSHLCTNVNNDAHYLSTRTTSSSTTSQESTSSSCYYQSSECDCSCDISLGVCDLNCCCDTDCSSGEIKYFESCHRGKYYGGKGRSTEIKTLRCSDDNSKDTVQSTKEPNFDFKRLSDFVEDEMKELLCIKYDNSAVTGEYFSNSHQYSNEKLIDSQKKEHSFNFLFNGDTASDYDYNRKGSYLIGDYIPISLHSKDDDDGSSTTYTTESILSLPASTDGGFCSSRNAVRFRIDTKSSCWFIIEDIERDCERSLLNADKFVSNILVHKEKRNINDVMTSIIVESFSSSQGNGKNASNVSGTNFTVWDSSNNVCRHALKSLKYRVYYNVNRVITEVKATINWTNLGNDTNLMKQDFEIEFIPSDEHTLLDTTTGKENITERNRNSNIGYHFSSPTLAGKKEDEIVRSSPTGLTVMNPGNCLHQNSSMVVGFGEDTTVSCTITLNAQELEDLCLSLNHEYLTRDQSTGLENLFLPKWLIQDKDVVGIYANANPDNHGDWVNITSDIDNPNYIVKSRVWNPSKKRCDGIMTKLQYHLFWSYEGNLNNPQAKIIRASKEYDENSPLIHKNHDDYKQHHYFTTTVSWTYIEPSIDVAHLSLPGFLFSVPNDVFYPFQRSSTSSQGKISISWFIYLSIICGYIFIIFL